MENLFLDCLYMKEFDETLNMLDTSFMKDITTYCESLNSKVYLESDDSLIKKINRFFADIITTFSNFVSQFKIDISRKIRSLNIDIKLRSLYKDMKEKKEMGAKIVEVTDVWKMREEYLSCVNELKKYAKRISNMNYKTLEQMDIDLENFNQIVTKFDRSLQNTMNSTKRIPIEKMMEFVERELSNQSRIINSLNDTITIFEQMRHDVEKMQRRKDILGPDIIPKHTGLIRRVASTIAKTIRKWVAKFIATIVMIVG